MPRLHPVTPPHDRPTYYLLSRQNGVYLSNGPRQDIRTFSQSYYHVIAASTSLLLGRRVVFRPVEIVKEEEIEVGVQEKIRRLLPVSTSGRFPSRT